MVRMETTDREEPSAKAEEAVELERLRAELEREHNQYLRALADFDNFRRRIERERGAAARSGKREVLLPLLDVLDGFDRALEQLKGAPAPVIEGVAALQRKLLTLLSAQGVRPLQAVGKTFNPELHEAIGSVPSKDFESNTVAEELQRGYVWEDELLRPARVRVAQ
jgi:molecular chaperone GrpE